MAAACLDSLSTPGRRTVRWWAECSSGTRQVSRRDVALEREIPHREVRSCSSARRDKAGASDSTITPMVCDSRRRDRLRSGMPLPFEVNYFHRVSIVAIAANLMVETLMTVLLLSGAAFCSPAR